MFIKSITGKKNAYDTDTFKVIPEQLLIDKNCPEIYNINVQSIHFFETKNGFIKNDKSAFITFFES